MDELLTARPAGPGEFLTTLPDGWHQGRGLFGGLLTGLMTRTLETFVPGRPLRSLTAELFAPAQPGPATLRVQVLREGNAVTTVSVALLQGDMVAHGVGVLGQTRVTDRERMELTPPTPGDWSQSEVLPIEPPLAPEFSQHWEFRPVRYLPLGDEGVSAAEVWVRPKSRGARRDTAYLACCADACWPTLLATEAQPRPMATIAFTFQPFLHSLEGLDPEAPYFHRARLVAATDGYVVEFRELWSHTGRLLALNQQTFVIIR